MGGLIRRLASAGALPTDDEEERLRKALLTLFPILITTMAGAWVATYLALGLRLPALIPLSYQVVSVAGLVLFLRTKRFRAFRTTQLALMLALPTLLQWSLGGFVTSSAVIVWAFASPLGALMLHGRRQAIGWFAAFVAAVMGSGLLEAVAPRAVAVPRGIVVTFFVLNLSGVALATFLMLLYFIRERDRAHRELAAEREKSERLLLNVLPASIAARLKEQEGVIADEHADVTVVFADIANFTPLSERMPPEETVALLDRVFADFDRLADRWGLEKIKTIGDAYMVAAGIPEPRPDHAEAAAHMALGMLEVVARCATDLGMDFSVRVGMESGPVVAGVIGRRKFIYDLWGDTVNTASRMESHGLPGAVQVGPRTYALLRDRFRFEDRGPIEVKGKGTMETHVLAEEGEEGRRRVARD